MIRGAKSIAEYAIRKWLREENFELNCFQITMEGNEAVLTDSAGDTLRLLYDSTDKTVYVAE